MSDTELTAEDKEAIEQLDKEVYLLRETSEKAGKEMDMKYAERVMRSQIEQIANLTEVLSNSIGNGEMESITKPSEIEGQQDGT